MRKYNFTNCYAKSVWYSFCFLKVFCVFYSIRKGLNFYKVPSIKVKYFFISTQILFERLKNYRDNKVFILIALGTPTIAYESKSLN